MRKLSIVVLCTVSLLLLSSCSPRDFLTRRLAADLIAGSDTFRAPQLLQLRTGILSNKDYLSPEYLLFLHRGWISATSAPCIPAVAPPPCWDILLTPSGVETVRAIVSQQEATKPFIKLPLARRTLEGVTGISKQGNVADVEFIWKWVPVNEVGAALYSSDVRYRSVVAVREYDDGWRIVQSSSLSLQTLDDALKNPEPAP
jgi:hypothetical protein